MAKKLFVGGLSWGTKEDTLKSVCERYGTVQEAVIVNDRETGRSRGFGFVTFEDEDAAMACIAELDGAELDNRKIRVSVAEEKSRAPRGPGGQGGNRNGGGFRKPRRDRDDHDNYRDRW